MWSPAQQGAFHRPQIYRSGLQTQVLGVPGSEQCQTAHGVRVQVRTGGQAIPPGAASACVSWEPEELALLKGKAISNNTQSRRREGARSYLYKEQTAEPER